MRALLTVGAEATRARWHPILFTPSAMPASTTPAQPERPIITTAGAGEPVALARGGFSLVETAPWPCRADSSAVIGAGLHHDCVCCFGVGLGRSTVGNVGQAALRCRCCSPPLPRRQRVVARTVFALVSGHGRVSGTHTTQPNSRTPAMISARSETDESPTPR